MLRAFNEQLRALAADPSDQFGFCVRKRAGKKASAILEKRNRDLILLIPGILGRVYSLWSHLKNPSEMKSLGGYLLNYMYSPEDFLSEKSKGLFGYLDDAYFAALVYETLIRELEKNGVIIPAEDRKFLEQLKPLREAAQDVIPKEAKKIESMLVDILAGRKDLPSVISK